MSSDKDSDRKPVRSILRALDVLESIGGDGKGISAISKDLQVSKGTVFDIVKTLESRGFVQQDHDGQSYRLGGRLLKLTTERLSKIDIVEMVRPYLQALSDEVGEVTHLSRREGFNALYLDRATSRRANHMLNLASQIGALSPLYCTSTGKIFMAYLSDDEFEAFLGRERVQYTSQTITDAGGLHRERVMVRERDCAFNLGEFEEGVSSIAVPIRDSRRTVIAAINFAMPAVRMPEQAIPDLLDKLRRTASAISADLGA